jgi:hypothetical protein
MLRMMVCASLYATALVAAIAETSSPPRLTPEDSQAIRNSAVRYLAQCYDDWDKQTHMSKEEWTLACQRVAGEREDFMLEHPRALSTPEG